MNDKYIEGIQLPGSSDIYRIKTDKTLQKSNYPADAKAISEIFQLTENDRKTIYHVTGRGRADNKYILLATLPIDNGNNAASVIISGRLGGMSEQALINILIKNRSSPTTSHSISGFAAMDQMTKNAFNCSDIILCNLPDGTANIYLKINDYFAYDLNIDLYQTSDITNVIATQTPKENLYLSSLAGKEIHRLSTSPYVLSRDTIYPVGSIYMTTTNTQPAAVFGGSWTKIEGRMLFGTTSDGYTAGGIGGGIYRNVPLPSHGHSYGDTPMTWSGRQPGNQVLGIEDSGLLTTFQREIQRVDNEGVSNARVEVMPPYYCVNIWRRDS